MECIIFDIDGTLADVEHRRHFLPNNGCAPDWKAFFDAMVDDPVMPDVVRLQSILWQYGPRPMVLCSGRPDNYRAHTEKWLADNGIHYDRLMMRRAGDHRSDVIVKREMLQELREEGFEPCFAVDDRQSVVDMWRDEGVTCLQCAPGDFDKPKHTASPGVLHMLIGPSGAGKSTFAGAQWEPDAIVSSDTIRARLLGNMRDQTQNDRVFHTLHELVRTRLALGLDTIVDATNLRNRDRRAVRECQADNGRIFYYVINRPMADKVRDGGWRNEVRIKGETLIERHENIFQSNLKDILAGDGDNRVTVQRYDNHS